MEKLSDTDLYIRKLLEANPLREPLLRTVIRSLQLPTGSRGLDAGCGIGLQELLLLEAIGPDGHITGLDILPELLAYGTNMVEQAGFAAQVTFRQGSVDNLPVAFSRNDGRLEFHYGDVRNAPLVDALVSQCDVVVHFAAETHVTRSIYDN